MCPSEGTARPTSVGEALSLCSTTQVSVTEKERRQIREAFDLTYRSSLNLSDALRAMNERTEWGPAAVRFRDFVRRVVSAQPPYKRGLCPLRKRDSTAEE